MATPDDDDLAGGAGRMMSSHTNYPDYQRDMGT